MIIIYSKVADKIKLHLRHVSTIGRIIFYRSNDVRAAKQAVLLTGECAITVSLGGALAMIAIISMSSGCLLTGYSNRQNTNTQLKALGGNIFFTGSACGLISILLNTKLRR